MIEFTGEELSVLYDIVVAYHKLNLKSSKYKKLLEEVKERLIGIEQEYEKLKNVESEYMDMLHEHYGDFSMQELYNSLNKLIDERHLKPDVK